MNSIEYRVKTGDTLSAIARRHQVTVAELSRLNGISDVNRIWAGQVLRIARQHPPASSQPPQPRTYRVRAGDTLPAIAQRHNVTEHQMTWQQLAEFNWGSSVPTVINTRLYKEVGCRKPKRPNDPVDPNTNYQLSSDDVKYGTGTILLPRPRLKNQIISFQGYTAQDDKKHGEADKVTGGSWRKIPGALDAAEAIAGGSAPAYSK